MQPLSINVRRYAAGAGVAAPPDRRAEAEARRGSVTCMASKNPARSSTAPATGCSISKPTRRCTKTTCRKSARRWRSTTGIFTGKNHHRVVAGLVSPRGAHPSQHYQLVNWNGLNCQLCRLRMTRYNFPDEITGGNTFFFTRSGFGDTV